MAIQRVAHVKAKHIGIKAPVHPPAAKTPHAAAITRHHQLVLRLRAVSKALTAKNGGKVQSMAAVKGAYHAGQAARAGTGHAVHPVVGMRHAAVAGRRAGAVGGRKGQMPKFIFGRRAS